MRLISALAALVLFPISACQHAPAGEEAGVTAAQATLQGTALYRERIALPADARLVVTISDVSLMDVAAPTIAEIEIAAEGRQPPLPFSLVYDRGRIEPRNRYAVSARILDNAGRLLWVTDTHVDLPAPGENVELVLVRAGR